MDATRELEALVEQAGNYLILYSLYTYMYMYVSIMRACYRVQSSRRATSPPPRAPAFAQPRRPLRALHSACGMRHAARLPTRALIYLVRIVFILHAPLLLGTHLRTRTSVLRV